MQQHRTYGTCQKCKTRQLLKDDFSRGPHGTTRIKVIQLHDGIGPNERESTCLGSLAPPQPS